MIRIRRARFTDVEGIGHVIKDIWKQDIIPDVCKAQIEDDARALWVATEDGNVAGFVSAFLTVVSDGRLRWEVDLLAVRPASRRQGLGTQLIRRASEAGQNHSVSLTRALIRVENVASRRAFENVGFTTDARVHNLFLWPPEPGTAARPYAGRVTLLPVDTLTYRGLWIEDLTSVSAEEQRRAVRAARSIIARDGRLNAGAVIPADRERLLVPDLRNQASMHGEYHWFIKAVKRKR